MNSTLEAIAREQLDTLLAAAKADLLTCYFYNPYSQLYWLFHKASRKGSPFRFPYQLSGPLTHPEQRKRLEHCGAIDTDEVITFATTKEDFLSGNILNGKSFAQREEVASCVRIRMFTKRFRDGQDAHVVTFLNFRGQAPKQLTKTSPALVAFFSHKSTFAALCFDPYVDSHQAWVLRSMAIYKQNTFADFLITHIDNFNSFLNVVLDQVGTLFESDRRRNCLVQLFEVKRNGLLHQLIGRGGTNPQDINDGVCYYVAKTAQVFRIDDIPEYRRRTRKGKPDPSCLPNYVSCTSGVLHELACPMIVQGKVVGVINLECAPSEGILPVDSQYTDGEALLLYIYATSIALALKQRAMVKDLRKVSELRDDRLVSPNEDRLFKETLKIANGLGFECGIWIQDAPDQTALHGRWVQGSVKAGDSVRARTGHTAWIVANRLPVAIADIDRRNHEHSKWVGKVDSLGYFEEWQSVEHAHNASKQARANLATIPPNPLIHELLERSQKAEVLCDFGLPVFSDRDRRHVRAVLWAKCYRHFVSILNDEMWFLSYLCMRASGALLGFQGKTTAILPNDVPPSLDKTVAESLLEMHFGEKLGREIYEHPRKVHVLGKRYCEKLVMLTFDLRGSTDFGKACYETENLPLFDKILATYHHAARRLILKHGGVFDKTIGDGVVAIFNAFGDGSLDLSASSAPPQGHHAIAAISCALEVFEEFERLWDEHFAAEPSAFNQETRRPQVAAGIVMATGYVGGSFSGILEGLDFTAYGPVANLSGKIVDFARADWLGRALQVSKGCTLISGMRGSATAIVTDADREAIGKLLLDRRKGILVTSGNLKDVIASSGQINGLLVDIPDDQDRFFGRIILIPQDWPPTSNPQ